MSNSEKYILDEIPKNGRIDNYLKEYSEIMTVIDIPKLEQFMFKVFNECKAYLKEQFNLNFPNMQLVIIYKKEEYAELLKKLDEKFGTRPYTKAVCVVSKDMSWIYIDFLSHFQGSQKDFIANLSVSFIEELVHSGVYPNKSETDVHELVCSGIEGFLEVELPDAVKEARLRYARKID
jgi:hypothetical protein